MRADRQVCAEETIADRARAQVQARMDDKVRLVELDFQPPFRESGGPDSSDMDFICRG